MLDQITPVILTFNEAPNLGRCLEAISWAHDIVVVDSGSTDETLDIAKQHKSVRLFRYDFETHGKQWLFAVTQTQIRTQWVLRLDADYRVTNELCVELATLAPAAHVSAYEIRFTYAIFGTRLRRSLYPPNSILFRPSRVRITDAGHTERWAVVGDVVRLKHPILHDDRKPIQHWVASQVRYMERELTTSPFERGWRSYFRLFPPVTPVVVFVYTLIVRGLLFDGTKGWFYCYQRFVAEAILALLTMEKGFNPPGTDGRRTDAQRRPKAGERGGGEH